MIAGTPAEFSRRLLRWYRTHRRDLPWRPPLESKRARPDPYHVLISEAMLQQTQVATVIPYFRRFIERFPTLADLAAADEQTVLRLWQGLGYYSRARNLRRCAIAIMQEHGGQIPQRVERLLALPGIGRYTAGAIASIAFGQRAPIVDGNVARVLCRLDLITDDPAATATRDLLWHRAEEILPPTRDVSDFNSALMELGAMLCTPRNPQCLICPVRECCQACAAGQAQSIPRPRRARKIPSFKRFVFCIRSGDRWLIEQRPAKGRWAGMWQFITREHDDPSLLPLKVRPVRLLGSIDHALTHRRYEFVATEYEASSGAGEGVWVTAKELDQYPMPRPHVKIAQWLSVQAGAAAPARDCSSAMPNC